MAVQAAATLRSKMIALRPTERKRENAAFLLLILPSMLMIAIWVYYSFFTPSI
jgi:hypothetical protein